MNPTPEQIATLRLIRTPHIGPQTFWKLLKRFQSPQLVIENWEDVQAKMKRQLSLIPERDIYDEVEKMIQSKGHFLFYDDSQYPSSLKINSDFPPVLSIKGSLDFLMRKSISIVGARNASSHGCRLAYLIAKELGSYGWTIVSGMARGIDASAHQGSLSTGTIAVLGNGLSVIYPEENKKLYNDMEEQGLIVSEFPFHAGPHVGNFPRRNKMIAALSSGVVVIEAANQSGSLLTAQHAVEMGKEIFSVPGSPLDPRCRGSNRLIKQGAVLTESVQDVLEVLDNSEWASLRKQNIDSKKKSSLFQKKETDFILPHLSVVPLSVDELAEITHLPVEGLFPLLIELELQGRIIRHPGNKISLALQG